jgi:hypothetical protein
MFRKTLVSITAAALLSTAALNPAFAKGGFGGGHGGFGGGHSGFGGFGMGHHGFGALAAGLAAVGLAVSLSNAAANCWQSQLIQTPKGYLKQVTVNVCE